jgi:hypothetical protein
MQISYGITSGRLTQCRLDVTNPASMSALAEISRQ